MSTLTPCAVLDYETRLYKGCGASELFSITSIVGCIWTPVSLITGFSVLSGLHALFFSFAVLILGTMLTVVAVASVFRSVKQGKPEGWHLRRLYCLMHPILSSNLILKSGCWSTTRGC